MPRLDEARRRSPRGQGERHGPGGARRTARASAGGAASRDGRVQWTGGCGDGALRHAARHRSIAPGRPGPLLGPPSAARRLLEAMPKAELHLHLDGSLRVETALELARTRGVDAPTTWAGMCDALVAPERCRDQAELLRAFDLPIALMQDAEALERIAAELVEAKAAEDVRYVEIRWGPLLHVARGLSLADGIAAVCRGARGAAERTGTTVRLIATALRSHDPADNVALAETAARFRDQGLTGWDLAGPEAAFPDPLLHARRIRGRPRRRAADHAPRRRVGRRGAGPAGARGRAGADRPRPGRGIDDPDAVSRAGRAGRLDLCPTSNVQAGIVPSLAEHPLARLHRAGVAGHALDRRHDGLRHHPDRGVRPGGRADRADAAGAVGDRPPGPRRRLRRRGDARAAPRRVRRVGGRDPRVLAVDSRTRC